MPSKEEIMLDAIKEDTTTNLTRYMLNGQDGYDSALEYFCQTKDAIFYEKNFNVVINDQAYEISYEFFYLKPILKAIGISIKELTIAECPCKCILSSIFYRVVDGASNLQKIIILGKLPEKYLQWIRGHTTAQLIFPRRKFGDKISLLAAKDSTKKSLVFDSVDFSSLLVPFADRNSFQSIQKLEIHGSFYEKDFANLESIKKFIFFLNGFTNLVKIQTYFSFCSSETDFGSNGFKFYPILCKFDKKMLKGLSPNLKGTLRFRACVDRFENMSRSMKKDIKEVWSKAANPIILDEKNSIIHRKFKIHDGLKVELSIDAIFSSLE